MVWGDLGWKTLPYTACLDLGRGLLWAAMDTQPLSGRTISHYRVLEKLGGGGMGVVYKAEDTKLKRLVALKFLPENVTRDPTALERFRREARAASAINHPNICTIYDIDEANGLPFIAMELLEGTTLKHRLTGQPLALEAMLQVAIDVADGLDAAHSRGIIHRDLKPANIFVVARGQAKILDFGLAKLAPSLRPGAESARATSMPTQANVLNPEQLTSPGSSMGTVAYMSPEQARGEELDARSDLFSLGVVLYEMATGAVPFSGTTSALVFDGILHSSPAPAKERNARLPVAFDAILSKALEKDADLRCQTAAEFRADLKRLKRDTESGRSGAVAASAPRSKLRPWLLGTAAVILVAGVVFYLASRPTGLFRNSSPPLQPTHRQITFVGDATYPALSPDGNFVAYVTGRAYQEQRLMLEDLKGGQAIEISRASLIWNPRWSPDGSEIAVRRRTDSSNDGVFLVPRLGGSSRYIAKGAYLCWSPNGNGVAAAWSNGREFRIVEKATGIIKIVHLNGFEWLGGLDWSPASNVLAVLTGTEDVGNTIWTVRSDGSQQRKVIRQDGLSSPRWSPAGDGIYCLRTGQGQTQDLLKIAVDPKSGPEEYPASVLLSGLQAGSYFTVSAEGTRLAYSRVQHYSNLWLAQLQGPDNRRHPGKVPQTTPLTSSTSSFDLPSVSPDAKWIAYASEGHIYKMPIEGGVPIKLTFSDATDFSPAWSADGKRIAFGSKEGGAYKVAVVGADGANGRQFGKTRLNEDSSAATVAWSPGRDILYQTPDERNFLVLDPDTGEEQPLLRDESAGWPFVPKYSPDANKVVVSCRGQGWGLCVISLVDHSETPLRGAELETDPLTPAGWSPDGTLIYAYSGNKMMSIPAAGGTPHIVFTVPEDIAAADVSADGKKFVFSVAETKSDVWIVDNFDPAYRK